MKAWLIYFGLLQQQQATMKRHGELLENTLRQQQEQSLKLVGFQEQLSTLEERIENGCFKQSTKEEGQSY